MGEIADIQNHGYNRQQDIQHAHNGDQRPGNFDNALAAAQHTVQERPRDKKAQNAGRCQGKFSESGHGKQRGPESVKAEPGKSGLQIVGAEHIVAHGVTANQGNRKDNRQRAAVKGRFDVVSRTAIGTAFRVPFLVNLGKGGFHERGRPAQNGSYPHPEHRAGTAHAQGR